MRIVVVSKKNLSVAFGKGKDTEIEFHNTTKLGTLACNEPTLFYVDLGLWEDNDARRSIAALLNGRGGIRVGVLDSKGLCEDCTPYFHLGCVDFVSRAVLEYGLKPTRYKKALAFHPFVEEETSKMNDSESGLLSGNDWSNVEDGEEYIFGFMFIELDNITELRDYLGDAGCKQYSIDLRNFLKDYLTPWDGYVWIWTDFGGAVLFPYNGSNYYAIEAGMELILNQECLGYSGVMRSTTFRVALHLGKTTFFGSGMTSEIVSDSVNSLFHLGHHFTTPASLHLTEDVKQFVPKSLEHYFVSLGEFEGREIHKLKDRV